MAIRSSRPFLTLAPFVLVPALCVATAFGAGTHRAIVTRIPPVYPTIARNMHIGGKVVLLVTIQADGSVSATKVESGHALLSSAAEEAVRRWRFAPATEVSETEVEVNFALDSQ